RVLPRQHRGFVGEPRRIGIVGHACSLSVLAPVAAASRGSGGLAGHVERGLVGLAGIGAVLAVHLAAGQRRVEHAGGDDLHARVGAQDVQVVLVERVHHARAHVVPLAGGDVLDRTGARDAVDALDMVLVVHPQLGAGMDGGDVEGKAHAVVLQQHAHRGPAIAVDAAFAVFGFGEVAYDHDEVSPEVQAAARRASRSAAATLCARMSRPALSCASSMVRGHSTLTTSSSAPLVSITRPLSKQLAHTRAAVSPSTISMPRIMPRPLTRSATPAPATISASRRRRISALRSTSRWKASSRQKSSRARVAVTKAWLLPRKVPLCSPGAHLSKPGRMSVTAKGGPMPESDLASVTTSGLTPARSKLKNEPVRPQPAWMSSTMNSAPCRRAIASMRRSQASLATLRPPSPWTVSTMIAAGLSRPEDVSSRRRSSCAAVSTSRPK